MKLIFLRERPTVDGAKGKFFQTSVGADGSFPSNHSMLAWSSAAVLADEYPSGLNQLAFYGVATGVSLTRVLGQQHFPSDVLVGSAFGWMIGHYVYKKHHRWHNEIFR
jgi:membrane-associated phospholipid phosphatase